ncbi:5-formyltetrahydrofolate cyclo-ligase [bacterium]|nr:5-formyltetrahydrofolate cyclo-ligase [bacterium]
MLKLSPRRRRGLGRAIRGRLAKVIRGLGPKRIFAFAATFGEPDLWPLYRKLLRRRTDIAFPKVAGGRMTFHVIRSVDGLRPGTYRILEPVRGRRAGRPRRNDLILVPCLGVDSKGWRLGHGGGYFDRWLSSSGTGIRLGVAFHVQVARNIPHTSRDERLDGVVTDRGVFWFSARQK